MRWSYPRAWKALNIGDTIRVYRPGSSPSIVTVIYKGKPHADREVGVQSGGISRYFGEFSRVRWEKVDTPIDKDRD